MAPGRPGLAFATAADWEAWLEQHHRDEREAWLRLARKGSRHTTVTQAEALDAALCFGWIDGKVSRLDDDFFLQRFTPRTRRSPWSRRNREKAAALEAEGRMRPAGLHEVERAKADGRWDAAYAGPAAIEVPDDLRRALDERPAAAASFAGLDSRNRYAILYRLHEAKRPETRARRLERFVAMLEAGETLHPRRRLPSGGGAQEGDG
jgi:uncharacterized protein YdeI (YjbR/CyaY-like superfamily)